MKAAARHLIPASLVLLAAAVAPTRAQAQNETVVLLRTATERGAYHLAEVVHQRGKIIPLDLGYIDFDHPKQYREIWIGAGAMPLAGPKGFLIVEGLLARAFGEQGNGATYFQPYFLGAYRIAPKVPIESVYFAYVPLNDAGTAQHLLERVKVEYDFARFKAGAGYSAYKFGEEAWHHKPFITGTLKAGGLGNFEVWLQRVRGDQFAVQFRYAKAFAH